jgi:hypothetical protein
MHDLHHHQKNSLRLFFFWLQSHFHFICLNFLHIPYPRVSFVIENPLNELKQTFVNYKITKP